MAVIERIDAPTKHTKGGVGDVYIDLTNGNKYKCVDAYSYTVLGKTQSEYTWRLIGKSDIKKERPIEVKESAIEKPVVEEQKEETPPQKPTHHNNNKKNYTQYSKAHK